jgi:glycosyltransferase involved in cell wall biosynthesis
MTGNGVSVIIPAYNVDAFIADAFASVAAQTRSVQEIIVIDDGSTDGTAAWLREMIPNDARLRVLRSDRLGPSGARNVGLEAATQSFIAFLDADDAWPHYKIERQMDRFAAPDRPDVVSGLIRRFHTFEKGALVPASSSQELIAHANLGACLFRRKVFDSIGLFEEGLLHCEDVDLMFRLRESGFRLAIMREVMLYYRIRPGSLTQSTTNEIQKELDALRALRLSIMRRRRSGGAAELPPFTALLDE